MHTKDVAHRLSYTLACRMWLSYTLLCTIRLSYTLTLRMGLLTRSLICTREFLPWKNMNLRVAMRV